MTEDYLHRSLLFGSLDGDARPLVNLIPEEQHDLNVKTLYLCQHGKKGHLVTTNFRAAGRGLLLFYFFISGEEV